MGFEPSSAKMHIKLLNNTQQPTQTHTGNLRSKFNLNVALYGSLKTNLNRSTQRNTFYSPCIKTSIFQYNKMPNSHRTTASLHKIKPPTHCVSGLTYITLYTTLNSLNLSCQTYQPVECLMHSALAVQVQHPSV